MDMSEFVVPKSDQLNSDDLMAGPQTIRIVRVTGTGNSDQPVAIYYEGDQSRPYKPCKSMRRVLIALWGPKADKWEGRSMRLYGDPSVKFGGQSVGGIRISHMTGIEGEKSLMLTVTRARRSEYKVKPMEPPKRKPLKAEIFEDKLPAIKALIEEGKSTPEQAITNLQKHYGEPSAAQRKEIRALGKGGS